jgi:hypothetical protein
VVFEKLFGDGSNNADRLARKQQSRSLLDSVMDQVASLQRELPASDRTRLGEHTWTMCGRLNGAFRKLKIRFRPI